MTRRTRHVVILGGIILGLILCLQLIYPYDTALPFARAFGQGVGGQSVNTLAAAFQKQFETTTVEFRAGTHVSTRKLPTLGATLNSERMAEDLTDYQWWQRLLPLSIVWLQPVIAHFDVTMSGAQVAAQAETLAKELSYPATSASIAVEGEALQVVSAQSGQTVTSADITHAIAGAAFTAQTSAVSLKGTELKPERIDSDVAQAKAVATTALSRELTINIPSRGTYTPDKATRAKWLTVTMDGAQATVTANREAIVQYVEALNANVKTDAVPVRVTMVDGVETTRSPGVNGEALDVLTVEDWLVRALVDGSITPTLSTTLRPVAPGIEYARSYTHTQAGLRAYVAYATTTQNVRIVVQQLDGNGWSASGRASESIPSASTYKLFVMLRVFDDINSGALTWDAPMLDTTAGGCFERTIVPSTNPCAEEWIRRYDRYALTNYVHSKGFSNGTGFTFNDATHTTAGDLATYLIGLYNGTLVSGNNRDMLLEKMGRQLYRYGIPTGTKGWTQDKVGFLWDYIHDAAIVHNPKGTYVLVIMTKGYSYGYIANVARQIDTILYD